MKPLQEYTKNTSVLQGSAFSSKHFFFVYTFFNPNYFCLHLSSGNAINGFHIGFCVGVLSSETVAQLIPDAGSPLHERVQQYRQLLDGLPMDAYTHGCILHPELTTDSMIPKYATAEIRSK